MNVITARYWMITNMPRGLECLNLALLFYSNCVASWSKFYDHKWFAGVYLGYRPNKYTTYFNIILFFMKFFLSTSYNNKKGFNAFWNFMNDSVYFLGPRPSLWSFEGKLLLLSTMIYIDLTEHSSHRIFTVLLPCIDLSKERE